MRLRPAIFLLMLFGGIALAEEAKKTTGASAVEPNKSLKGYAPEGGAGRRIFEVPVEGTIDLGLAPFIERVVDDAGENDVVFLNMNTLGGRVDGAIRMRDSLLNARGTTVVYVSGRAISAGALISLACDTIIMHPGATIGDAMPIRLGAQKDSEATSEKAISYMREEMAATAKAKGRRGDIARSMVDPDIVVKDVVGKGKLLTLDAQRAVELKMADALADNFEDAVALLNLREAQRVEMTTHWAESVARILTDPIVSSLLMTFGVLGLLMEFYTPGFGVGGVVGIVCLTLFFLGQYTAHLAGWEEALLLIAGMVLIGIEIFVTPGFGVIGLVGVTFAVMGLMMALVELDLPLDVSFELGLVQSAITTVAIRLAILLGTLVGGTLVFGKYFPQTRLGKRLILGTATTVEEGYVSQAETEDTLVGKRGTAAGDLRPAGIAEIDGARVDVVTLGDYIKRGATIEVIRVDGNRIVVKKV